MALLSMFLEKTSNSQTSIMIKGINVFIKHLLYSRNCVKLFISLRVVISIFHRGKLRSSKNKWYFHYTAGRGQHKDANLHPLAAKPLHFRCASSQLKNSWTTHCVFLTGCATMNASHLCSRETLRSFRDNCVTTEWGGLLPGATQPSENSERAKRKFPRNWDLESE